MTEQDILNLISEDKWMMGVLHIAEELNLPNWLIGAGFVRNKVWDYLHGYSKQRVDTADIDLVYYDPNGNDENTDKKLSAELNIKTGLSWEVVNEAHAHKWYTIKPPPYISTEDAVSKWPETATCIGVKIENGELKLIAPHGVEDLINLIVRPNKGFIDEGNVENVVVERVKQKKWLEKWPKLKMAMWASQ
ncbi:MAG: nucleotidyltransferase family protein [Patescibacteria group bacterium]